MHEEPPPERAVRRGGRGDLVVALGLALFGALLHRAFFQARMLGDGAGLATFFARGDTLAYHFLYLPACRLVAPLAALVPGDASADPIEPTRVLSAVAAGIAWGATWLLARDLGAGRFGAAVGALLAGLSPAAVFFGTTVEVHALHFAVVAIAAWATLKLPWRRSAVALPLAGALFGLVFWAHQIALLLGPGWILLCQIGRARRAPPFSARTLVFAVGPVLLAGAAAASALATRLRGGALVPSAGGELEILAHFARPPDAWWFLRDGWLKPLALLVPAAAAGLALGGLEGSAKRALLVLIGVPLAFLVAWGVSEYGGYALGHAPFLACLAASAFRRPSRRAALGGALLVAAQAALAIANVRAFDRGFDVKERVELVRSHVGSGVFVSTVDNAPRMSVYFPVTEVALWDAVLRAKDLGWSDEEIVQTLLAEARGHVEASGRVLFDLGFETQLDRAPIQARARYFAPLAQALEASFQTTRIEHQDWPMLVVER